MPGRADLYDGIIVSVGLFLTIFSSNVPEGALRTLMIIVGFGLVIGDAVLIELIFEWITMHYPYLRIELQPSGTVLHFFLEKNQPPKTTPITKIFNSTKLVSHWVVEHPYYGKIKECNIHHELDFSKRVIFGSGYAFFQGYYIRHPQTATIVCHEYPYSSDRYKNLSIPSFMLAYAYGGDVNLVPLPLTSMINALKEGIEKHPEVFAGSNPKGLSTILSALKHYEEMQFNYLEANRTTQYYRAEKLRLEHGEASKDSQTKALLAAGADSREQAWEIVLSWHTLFGAFDKIVKKMKPRREILLNKWLTMVIIVAIGAITLAYLSTNRNITTGISNMLSQTTFQVLIMVLALITLGIVYFVTQKWRK